MIADQDLAKLLTMAEENKQPVLTLYLEVDQSNANNLNRGFERTFKNLVRDVEQTVDEDEQKRWRRILEHAHGYLGGLEPKGRTLLLIMGEEGPVFEATLPVALESRARYSPRPLVKPLIEARDEYERYGVLLTDRAHSRLFTVYMGAIEEHRDAFAEFDVHKFDASSKDHLHSQMQFQRKADHNAKLHLKEVAERMVELEEDLPFDRLILGGPEEVVREIEKYLDKSLAGRLAGTVSIAVDATEKEVLQESMQVARERERQDEGALLERLFTDAAKDHRAVLGLNNTVDAVQGARVQQLVYAQDFSASGRECIACGALYSGEPAKCRHCQGELRETPDLLERLVERVAQSSGVVEEVRDDAADKLKESGAGIGALLRF